MEDDEQWNCEMCCRPVESLGIPVVGNDIAAVLGALVIIGVFVLLIRHACKEEP